MCSRRFLNFQNNISIYMYNYLISAYILLYPRSTGGGYSILPLFIRPSIHPKIFFVTFFSATIDGRNLIIGHKLHIGMPYCGNSYFLFSDLFGFYTH